MNSDDELRVGGVASPRQSVFMGPGLRRDDSEIASNPMNLAIG
jgi:hypothetical protein